MIVGGGHNRLIAAAYLARAGRGVLVLERGPKVGSAVRSGETTAPGFVHDLFATNLNRFLGSPVHAEFASASARRQAEEPSWRRT